MVHTRGREPGREDTKTKWREDEEATPPANIMFDRRVVRGNTYAPRTLLPERLSQLKAPFQRRSSKRELLTCTVSANKGDAIRNAAAEGIAEQRAAVTTPAPVEGRCHAELQTEPLYEELSDKFPVADGATQTDGFFDRPPTPIYIPKKTGVDVDTQILPGDSSRALKLRRSERGAGELFDFGYEVEPLVTYLVGKTLEQSLLEVHDELEHAALKQRREHMEKQRALALAAVQRMEAAEKRRIEEKERRLAEEQERLERENERRRRVAAQTFARECLNGIVQDVFSKLDAEGHFREPVEEEIKTAFLPWLNANALQHLQQRQAAKEALLAIVEAATEQRKREIETQRERHLAALEANRQAAAEAERVKAEEAEVFRERLQQTATLLLQQTDPSIVDPELIDAARAAIQARSESEEEVAVSDAQVVEELIRVGTVSQEALINAMNALE